MCLKYFICFIQLMYCIFFTHLITHDNRRRLQRRQQHKGAGAKAVRCGVMRWTKKIVVCDEVNEEDAVHQVDKVT